MSNSLAILIYLFRHSLCHTAPLVIPKKDANSVNGDAGLSPRVARKKVSPQHRKHTQAMGYMIMKDNQVPL